MSFFNNLVSSVASGVANKVVDTVRRATGTSPPYDVLDINPQQLSRMKLVMSEGDIKLYGEKNGFNCVIHKSNYSHLAFSLFRVASESEAVEMFNNYSFKLELLGSVQSIGRKLMTREQLQQLCDVMRSNPGWNCCHLATKLGLIECFSVEDIAQCLSVADESTGVTPIMIAVENENLNCVKELLIRGARLDVVDGDGNTVFHYAARSSNETIIQFLASKDRSAVNRLNSLGESAMHEACLKDRPQNVQQLLTWGSDPNITSSYRYPIHCAVEAGSIKCIQLLCRWARSQIHVQDKESGGTPLHWATTRECIYALVDLGANIDALNNAAETALHIAIRANRLDCAMGLLAKGADARTIGPNGENTLHMAIEVDSFDLVQLLIVFGADINGMDNDKLSPRHKAATSGGQNKDQILYLLHCVGARRCEVLNGCQQGCAAGANFDGVPKTTPASTPDQQRKLHSTLMTEFAMAAAMSRSSSTNDPALLVEVDSAWNVPAAGDRVLCLDGGGIRGLVLIQMLQAIETAVGRPIRECFDWIAGTSTGGILALAIVHGKTVRHCLGAYFQLKDDVFCGKRPYSSEPLETFLKKEFGETTRMSEREYPRVIVTGVLADRMPAELHLFRNYEVPGSVDTPIKSHTAAKGSANNNRNSKQFEPLPRYTDQYVWRAARSSGAAPTYFRAFGRFLDGGLMANNPTLDMLTEIHQFNIGLHSAGQAHLKRPIHVVVSLGTGCLPQRPVEACDVYRPEGLFDIAKVVFGAKNLAELLVDQATQSEGRAVERAAAWCSSIGVPYFRFSPQLSEDIALDCKDDRQLVNMLWETQCYLYEHRDRIQQLAELIRP